MNDLLLTVVAAATFLVGVVLGVMMWRRRTRTVDEATAEPARAEEDVSKSRQRPWRPIDDYAIPVDFERDAPQPDDDEVSYAGKICPRCGTRYRSHSRVCEHDQSELASLN